MYFHHGEKYYNNGILVKIKLFSVKTFKNGCIQSPMTKSKIPSPKMPELIELMHRIGAVKFLVLRVILLDITGIQIQDCASYSCHSITIYTRMKNTFIQVDNSLHT